MALWKRSKKEGKEDKEGDGPSSSAAGSDSQAGLTAGASGSSAGIVSSVLSGSTDATEQTPFGDIVSRRFGPGKSDRDAGSRLPPQHSTAAGERGNVKDGVATDGTTPAASTGNTTPAKTSDGRGDAHDPEQIGRDPQDRLRAVTPLFSDQPATPELEVDLMAHIGRETTITGDIVAEEDLEIQGTVEGSVRLANHQVTVGNEGHVKASVDAHTVIVFGKITGDVMASELVEIEKGGIVGGDIRSPRIIMHDGAIVVGRLDMSASLPNLGEESRPSRESDAKDSVQSARPKLEWIETEAKPESAQSGEESTV